MNIVIRNKRIENLNKLIEFLVSHPEGKYKISLAATDTPLEAIKKRYYAMVDELAKHAGYRSRKDRDLFKEQIKKELGDESIKEMTEIDQVSIKIEELHQLALSHYSYFFIQIN